MHDCRKERSLTEWTTHGLSGIALGYIATQTLTGAAIGGIASIIPDLDDNRSVPGKIFFFFSIPLRSLLVHRTATHSFACVFLVGTIAGLIFHSPFVAVAAMAGVLAHILGDMATGTVQILWPFGKRYGIRISHFQYLIIDRITRVSLLLLISIFIIKHIGMNWTF